MAINQNIRDAVPLFVLLSGINLVASACMNGELNVKKNNAEGVETPPPAIEEGLIPEGKGQTATDYSISVDGSFSFVLTANATHSVKTLLTIKNTGTDVLDYKSLSFDNSFVNFSGQSYPGTNGSCGPSVGANESCTIEIEFVCPYTFSESSEIVLDFSDVKRSITVNLESKGGHKVPSFADGGVYYRQDGTDTTTLRVSSATTQGSKLYAAGHVDGNFLIYAFSPDGSLDNEFGNSGLLIDDLGTAADKIVDVEAMKNGNLAFGSYKVGTNWKFISSVYDIGGSRVSESITLKHLGRNFSVGVDRNDNLILAGRSDTTAPASILVGKTDSTGQIDTSFGSSGYVIDPLAIAGAYSIIYSTEVFKTGVFQDKIVMTGLIDETGSNDDLIVIRMNSDGSLDTTFNSTGYKIIDLSGGDDYGSDVEINEKNGDVAVIGYGTYGGETDGVVIKLKSDGSLDTDFAASGIFRSQISGNDYGRSIETHPFDGYLIAVDDTTGCKVMNLNAEGYLVSKFGANGVYDPEFDSIDDVCADVIFNKSDNAAYIVSQGTKSSGTGLSVMVSRFTP